MGAVQGSPVKKRLAATRGFCRRNGRREPQTKGWGLIDEPTTSIENRSRSMLPHHARIAAEYEADALDIKRERRRLALQTLGSCWLCVIVGAGLMGESFHINATVGWIYYPRLMAKAQAFFSAGLFVGVAGPFASLVIGAQRAMSRGLLS